MSNNPKGDQALALIAALQTILDGLPDSSDPQNGDAQSAEEDEPLIPNPTHELFVDRIDQGSLAGLFTSIRIIHNIHNVAK